MNYPIFELEEYLGKYEFTTPYLMGCSDAETLSMQSLIQKASQQTLELWNSLQLGYTEVRGLPILRKKIAEIYNPLNKKHVTTFCGAEEAIHCSLTALIEPHDHVIVLTPCYQSLKEIPRILGAEVTEIPLLESQEWRCPLEQIQNQIKPNTKAVIINFPHNPTGQVLRPTELNLLIEILKPQGIYLFSDEVYRLLGKPLQGWCLPAAVTYEKGISIGVMSKAYGLAGLRVGWMITQDTSLMKKTIYQKHYTSICNSAPSEILALMALEQGAEILSINNQIVKTNLDILDEFFNQYKELFKWIRPEGGCVGWVRYCGADGMHSLVKKALANGVLILPATVYQTSEPYFRIGFGRKNMVQALDAFKKVL